MKTLAIVISFDVGKQVMPGSIPRWIASSYTSSVLIVPRQLSMGTLSQQFPFRLMDWIIPAASRSLRVISGSVLAAAIGVVDEARRRRLPLDGHGQGRNGQFHPHVIAHRPANDPSCE
jgi:hypothetical protein